MARQSIVADYMVKDVMCVEPDMTVKEVSEMIIDSPFHGLPVAQKGFLLSFITAKEMLRHFDKPDVKIREIMKKGTISANPTMSMDDATRVLFRYGLRNLPIVDENRKLVGMISNIDIVRSHIEKSKPHKVQDIKSFLEGQHGIRIRTSVGEVPLNQIRPSQKEVFQDELIGRQFEIKKNLIEPLIVVKRRDGYLLVDGHHRVMAAREFGLRSFRSVILEPDLLDIHLGLEKTAERWGLRTLDDVVIIEGSKHPFVEITTRLLDSDSKKRLEGQL
jgi:IMP dehydrogenase